jgi:hypothetical protein
MLVELTRSSSTSRWFVTSDVRAPTYTLKWVDRLSVWCPWRSANECSFLLCLMSHGNILTRRSARCEAKATVLEGKRELEALGPC